MSVSSFFDNSENWPEILWIGQTYIAQSPDQNWFKINEHSSLNGEGSVTSSTMYFTVIFGIVTVYKLVVVYNW